MKLIHRNTRADVTLLAATCRNDFDTKPVELLRLLGKIRALRPEELAS